MAYNKNFYAELEQIVGAENVSDHPAILDSYAWRAGLNAGPQHFVERYAAVVLPETTEEVSSIVKACNRHGVSFKASSTGWGPMNDPAKSGELKIDLRRMNKIVEINTKDMYVCVEPYVIGAQLQAELMKEGYHCNLNGAGGQCTALPIGGHENIGHLGMTCGSGERNQLGLEWVTPEGEIICLGSAGASGSWFSGDGPGPSLRGVVRGPVSANGGIGVFTKAAMKIYPWPGPSIMDIKGISPHYYPESMPEHFAARYISFCDSDSRNRALQMMGENELAQAIMGFSPGMLSANMATDNEEDLKLFQEIRDDSIGPGLYVCIAGNSDRDFSYKMAAFNLMLEKLGAHSYLPLETDEVKAAALIWRCTRLTASIRETMRMTGSYSGALSGCDVTRLMEQFIVDLIPDKLNIVENGLAYDDGADAFVCVFEQGHYGHGEMLIRYDSDWPGSLEAMMELGAHSFKNSIDNCMAVSHSVMGDEAQDLVGVNAYDFQTWLRKIKDTFDPNDLADGAAYITVNGGKV